MENNQLRLSTDDADTVRLQWDKVDSVFILNNMRILLEDGEILYGKVLPSGEAKGCMIWHTEGDPRQASLVHIVALSPVENTFVSRLDGSIGSGFSYTKASEVMQANVTGKLSYLAETNYFEINYGGIFTRESSTEENTQWQTGGFKVKLIQI